LPLFEMANLEPHQTGIEGTIYISTKQGSHNELRDFWFNGNTWYQREVDAFIAGLEKYPASVTQPATPSRPRRR
jgi:hypothetical protein